MYTDEEELIINYLRKINRYNKLIYFTDDEMEWLNESSRKLAFKN
jgi:hypothetical protein